MVSASRGDPHPVLSPTLPRSAAALGAGRSEPLDRLTRLAALSLRAPVAAVLTWDGAGKLRAASTFGLLRMPVLPASLVGRVLASVVAAGKGRGQVEPEPGVAREIGEVLGLGACLAAPLLHLGVPVGVLAVGSPGARTWAAHEGELLGEAAALAAQCIPMREGASDRLARRACGAPASAAVEVQQETGASAPHAAPEAQRAETDLGGRPTAPPVADQASDEAVRRSEEHFRSLIEYSADVIDILDADGVFRYVTPSVRRVLEWEPEELVGRSVFDLVHPEDRERMAAVVRAESRAQGGSRWEEVRILHRSGVWRTFEASVRDLLDNPSVAGIVVTSRDVTARKQADAALRRGAAILAAIPDAVVVTDLSGVVTYWNEGATRLFGWDEHEMLGHPLAAHLPRAIQARFAAEMQQIAAGREVHGEYEDVKKDGSRILTDTRASLIRDEQGTPVAILRIARDITQQRLMGRVLEEIPEAVVCLDAEDRIVACNAAAEHTFGYSLDELIGEPFRVLAPEPGAVDADPGDIPAAARREGGWTGEVVRKRRDGSHFPAQLVTSVVRDSQGRVIGQAALFRDLSQEKQREAQLRRADRLASVATVLSGLAHELNNPLTSIKSFAQLLLLDERSAEDRDGLEVIQQEADRAAKLVADLRALARQAQEAAPVPREAVDVNRLVRRVIQARRTEARASGIALETDLAADLPPVHGDAVGLQEAARQFVLHAEQVSLRGGSERRVVVRTRPAPGALVLTVTDSAPAPARAELERFFDPFWTTDARNQELALAMSKAQILVEQHGGAVRAERAAVCGTTIRVELPCAIPASAALPNACAASVRRRVLLVEPAAPVRESLAQFLEARGHQVDAVPGPAEALDYLDAGRGHETVVFSLSRGSDGSRALLDRLGAGRADAPWRTIFLVDEEGRADAERIAAATGAPVVVKPFALAEVAALIETAPAVR